LKMSLRILAFSRGKFSKKGMALPLSLIMLLVAGVLVGVSMYIVENLASVSRMKSTDELIANAAVAGIEEGKIWLAQSFAVSRSLPKRSGLSVSQSELSLSVVTPLLARRGMAEGIINGVLEGVPFQAVVYDIDDVDLSGLQYESNAPPVPKGPPGGYSYVTEGVITSSAAYGIYLIRSRASLDGIEKNVEQFVLLEF